MLLKSYSRINDNLNKANKSKSQEDNQGEKSVLWLCSHCKNELILV